MATSGTGKRRTPGDGGEYKAPGLVPDPASGVGSNYDECAEWLAAVLELDAMAYRRIVRGWAVPHARRKNLWLAITRRRLPR